MKRGIFGGTFDYLHDGHLAMLNTAFIEGDELLIGITTDTKANKSRERDVNPYTERVNTLEDSCKTLANIHDTKFTINPISDAFDAAIKADADFIVLSPEEKTHARASKINTSRIERGKNRLQIIEAPMVTDYDGRKISATRIANNEINTHGEKR